MPVEWAVRVQFCVHLPPPRVPFGRHLAEPKRREERHRTTTRLASPGVAAPALRPKGEGAAAVLSPSALRTTDGAGPPGSMPLGLEPTALGDIDERGDVHGVESSSVRRR